jgi:hypothetical protein
MWKRHPAAGQGRQDACGTIAAILAALKNNHEQNLVALPYSVKCGEETASTFSNLWKIERPVPDCYKQSVSEPRIARLLPTRTESHPELYQITLMHISQSLELFASLAFPRGKNFQPLERLDEAAGFAEHRRLIFNPRN